MGETESDRVDHKAPKGKYRVVVCDTFSNDQAVVGDFEDLEKARQKASDTSGQMMIAYVHNDRGLILYQYGTY